MGEPRWPSNSPMNDCVLKISHCHILGLGGLVLAPDVKCCILGLFGFLFR